MSAALKWPGGPTAAPFIKYVRNVKHKVLNGRLLAVDPASGKKSSPGYALYEKGELVESGVIDIPGGGVGQRLSNLFVCLAEAFKDVDVLAIEKLRRVHPTLFWAAGVTVAAVNAPVLVEVPITFWKTVARQKAKYAKADDADAECIGEVLVFIAREK